jgi:hypothetical protein
MSRQPLSPPLSTPARRGLWLALALMLLAVQTGMPAHQDSHPLGQADNLCHYCMLGGHAPGVLSAALPQTFPALRHEAPQRLEIRPAAIGFFRNQTSRAPPSVVDA